MRREKGTLSEGPGGQLEQHASFKFPLPPSTVCVPVGSEPGVLTFGRACPSEPSCRGHCPCLVLLSGFKARPVCGHLYLSTAPHGPQATPGLGLQGQKVQKLKPSGEASAQAPAQERQWVHLHLQADPAHAGLVPLPDSKPQEQVRQGLREPVLGPPLGLQVKRAVQPQKPKAHLTLSYVPGFPQIHNPSCHWFAHSLIYSCIHYAFNTHG